ncbi:unnamed protein product [Vitrella brassicaformis CCMP3155]|uniref:Uncharacterized protein n=1 Tax=Vitrella brassicaformis (strain CCMP3155) TaxID=1169540 RepID=A0A0G4FHL1_VITBC|nr:unnamed protein product [Vitrella brassicaformis CCMP3155]|eukprot:CEM12920.1 unnamed protein product [Vitrella brassicaformis CCMP3155]
MEAMSDVWSHLRRDGLVDFCELPRHHGSRNPRCILLEKPKPTSLNESRPAKACSARGNCLGTMRLIIDLFILGAAGAAFISRHPATGLLARRSPRHVTARQTLHDDQEERPWYLADREARGFSSVKWNGPATNLNGYILHTRR